MLQTGILKGKAAFVAGGTSGINLGIARALAEAGASVAVLSRSQEKVDGAVAELRSVGVGALGYAADVRNEEAVAAAIKAAADTMGPLDVVVSGAAGNFICPAAAMSGKGFRTVIEIDLIGTFHVMRAAFDVARKPGCSMINISAPQSTMPYWGQAHVSAAKAGVDMLTKSLAYEWGEYGIRLNAIVPGPIEGTEGMKRLSPTDEARRAVEDSVPLRRYGTISDIAEIALFLASDQSSYVTGTVIACDGGQLLAGAGLFRPPLTTRQHIR